MKHRITAFVLVLLFVFTGHGKVNAEETIEKSIANAINLSSIKPYENIQSLCWVKETLYILGVYGIYAYNLDEDQLFSVIDLSSSAQYQYVEHAPAHRIDEWRNAIRYIFTDGETLYGLHPYSGDVFVIEQSGLQKVSQISPDILQVQEDGMVFTREIKSLAFAQDKLYVLLGTDDYNDFEKTQLVSFDMGDQTVQMCSPTGIQSITTAGLGKLAITIKEDENAVWLYNTDSDSLEQQLLAFQDGNTPSGLVWYASKKALIHFMQNQVTLTTLNGESQIKGYLPISYANINTAAACSLDGVYAYPYGEHVFLRNVGMSGEVVQTVIHILGETAPNILVDFSIEHPEIAVVSVNTSANEYLQQAFVTEDNTIDIFLVSATDHFAAIKKKGYALPLSINDTLLNMAHDLYPAIRDVIFDQNDLYAYPISFIPHSWSINETIWKELGLKSYPKTYDELYELISIWLYEHAQEYPEYVLSDIQQISFESFIISLVKEYIFQTESLDTQLTFDTAEFRELIYDAVKNAHLLSEDNEQWGLPLISSDYQGFGNTYNDNDLVTMLLPPTINKTQEQSLNASMDLLVINTASTKQDAAFSFVAFCAKNLDTPTRYSITPSLIEPVRNANYESRLETLTEELATLEDQLTSADEVQKRTIQEEIDQKKLMIESVSENEWSISAENIEAYRSVVEHLRIPYASAFLGESMTGGFSAIQDIISQYCSDGLTEDEITPFIKALDQVTYMVYMEGQ